MRQPLTLLKKQGGTMLLQASSTNLSYDFASDVRAGLMRAGQKQLPSKYLYDEIGSTLFEVISHLPEYGLTRADERLLRRHAPEIVDAVPGLVAVAELGSGSGRKTRWILESLSRRQRTSYYPIEISHSALVMCERELGDIDSVNILGFEREYLDGLLEVAALRRENQHLMVLFLGSTIGNFSRDAGIEFLSSLRGALQSGDSLLLGTDLEKPASQLIRAYDDKLGVTAAFNLNLLARINRELDADFDLNEFVHQARVNHGARRVEMHLCSRRNQRVRIAGAEAVIDFSAGESIWTESSHKYAADEIPFLAAQAGFRCTQQWIDSEWPFAENLLIAE
jgi:L-histidine Nalpha-methyltransferase